jgi:pimeloyl-ACP methyl ester carboxylesterase
MTGASVVIALSLYLTSKVILRPIEAKRMGSLHYMLDQGCNVYHSEVKGSDTYLVFIHGLGGQMPQFESQIQHLSRRFNIIALDYIGHGESQISPFEKDYEIDAIVDTLYTILSHLNVIGKKLVFIGHSLGCLIGNLLAQKIPVLGMIAIAPKTMLSEKECKKAHRASKLPIWCLDLFRFFDSFAGTHSPSVNRMLRPKASLVHRRKQLAFNKKTSTRVIRNMLRGLRPAPQEDFVHILPKLAVVLMIDVGYGYL